MEYENPKTKTRVRVRKDGQVENLGKSRDMKRVELDNVAKKVEQILCSRRKLVGPHVAASIFNKEMHIALNHGYNHKKYFEDHPGSDIWPEATKEDVLDASQIVIKNYSTRAGQFNGKDVDNLTDAQRAIRWVSRVPLDKVRVYGDFTSTNTSNDQSVHGEIMIKEQGVEGNKGEKARNYREKINQKMLNRQGEKEKSEEKEQGDSLYKPIRIGGTFEGKSCKRCHRELEANKGAASEQRMIYRTSGPHNGDGGISWRTTDGKEGVYAEENKLTELDRKAEEKKNSKRKREEEKRAADRRDAIGSGASIESYFKKPKGDKT
ncbi:hypothetical protein COO91_10923 (plasmid) [Nostoc flagelliforme CCNUN1]|uniref:Uncharacterized protein n=1 Tax=Nostoc flagelliforme CCNUN1 TaxID=2038116 RepID=A0A2K8TCA5_9NOSO|nr:hypothetical protein [Nostoc flagelliforme]AUB44685.1 hypothetical protein COO91_10923 [Nostoc flagelliforme CCNUN1]